MINIKLPAVMDNLDQMIDFVLKGLDAYKINDQKIRLACEEALVNVINYAYGEDTGELEIIKEVPSKENKICIEIIDEGIAFNPLKKEEPDINKSMEERSIGGLGIFMIKEIMDKVEYKREEGKNILKLEKYFDE